MDDDEEEEEKDDEDDEDEDDDDDDDDDEIHIIACLYLEPKWPLFLFERTFFSRLEVNKNGGHSQIP